MEERRQGAVESVHDLTAGATHDFRQSLSDTPQSPAPETPDEAMPRQIDRYHIHKVLGKGGFGRVYLAHDPQLDRSIALKVARRAEDWSDLQAHAFVDEARTTAKLNHAHIVTIYDSQLSDSCGVFIAMEYVKGMTLSQRLRKGPLPLEAAINLIAQVAEAVHYGHKHGVIHRDLKPSNILLENDHTAKVSDFGLALTEGSQVRSKGQVSGTPAYMSPEQIRGEGDRLDGRADIWSLGVILYEALTGRRPFVGGSYEEIFEQVLNREPKPLRQFDDSIPKAIDELCLRCLSRNAAERPPTALELSRELRRALEPPREEHRWKWVALATLPLLLAALAIPVFLGPEKSLIPPAAVAPADTELVPGRWYSLLEKPPEPLVWTSGYPIDHYSFLEDLNKFSVHTAVWAVFGMGENQGRDFEMRVNLAHEGERGKAAVCWGFHRDLDAFPEEQDRFCGIAFRRMAPNELQVRLTEFRTRIGPGGVPYVFESVGRKRLTLSYAEDQPWYLEVAVTDGVVTRFVFQDQLVDVSDWPQDLDAFADGKFGVMDLNGYLVVTDMFVNFQE